MYKNFNPKNMRQFNSVRNLLERKKTLKTVSKIWIKIWCNMV